MGRPAAGTLVLNNYSESGIGDWGVSLLANLRQANPEIQEETTIPRWSGFFRQILRILSHRGVLVANLGLTGWGSSGPRNLLGYAALGVRAKLRGHTVVLIHHVIEVLDLDTAGYRVSEVTRRGAQFAIELLKSAQTVVFTGAIYDAVAQNYGFLPTAKLFLPCHRPRNRQGGARGHPRIVTLGYIAPYKGIDLFIPTCERLGSDADGCIIGSAHRVLSSIPESASAIQAVLNRAQHAGIKITGRLSDDELSDCLNSASLALLSYRSSSGGSAAFATLAESCLPVVASRLPTFVELEETGAGVVLCEPSPDVFADTIRKLLTDERAMSDLRERQRRYAEDHSWDRFVRELSKLC